MKVSLNNRPPLKKRLRVKQVLPTQCLNCDSEAGYSPREVTREIEFRGEPFSITYTHLACPACGEAILSDPQIIAQQKQLVQAYQERHGLLTAAALIQQRQALGYNSQRSFLTAAPELSAATLKRIEAGVHAQDASTDAHIRKVLEDLEKAQILELLNEPMAAPTESNSVSFNVDGQSRWDPLAAAACVAFAAGSIVLASGNRITHRECENNYNEVRIESC